MLTDRVVREAFVVWSIPVLLLCAALALTGCATPAPATTFIVAEAVEETPPDITPVAADIAQEVAPDVAQGVTPNVSPSAGSCDCLNCTCDPCTCQAVAKAEPAYAPEQINGEWYCTHNGQRLKWTAVRCYGPGLPCDYEWRPAPSQSNSSASLTSSPACATGNCGTSAPGRTIRRARLFGRR